MTTVFRVDVQFKDSGTPRSRNEYLQDQFIVYQIQNPGFGHAHQSIISQFNIPRYKFYKKGLRATRITEAIRNWLQNTTQEYFYIKFKKVNNTDSFRFVSPPENMPSLILHSNSPVEIDHDPHRTRRSSPNPPICPNDNSNNHVCCLRNVTVQNDGDYPSLEFIDLPDDFYVTICVGSCRKLTVIVWIFNLCIKSCFVKYIASIMKCLNM